MVVGLEKIVYLYKNKYTMAQTFTHFDTDSLLVGGTVTRSPMAHFYDLHVQNMKPEELNDMKIFKIYGMKGLIPLLSNSKLFIDRVSSWEDVYENFFLKEEFFSKSMNMPIGTADMANGAFGQSWTWASETDAMWRIYSSDKKSVRVQTSALKLFSAIFIDDSCIADTWMGKVEYNSETEMNQFLLENTKYDSVSIWRDLMPYTHFLKRNEFSHEKEFRIIKMLDSAEEALARPYLRLAFNINVDDFIESYMLDPRLDDNEFENQKQELVSLGANPGKITKSQLYHFTPIRIELD